MPPTRFVAACVLPFLVLAAAPASFGAKLQDWTEKSGAKFRASPVRVLGPFALFLTEKKGGKRVQFSQLSEADCVRFDAALDAEIPRAERWSEARSSMTKLFLGNTLTLINDSFVNPEFAGFLSRNF